VLTAARDGNDLPKLSFTGEATVCKYAVPEGYPTDPDAGAKIAVDEESVGDALLYYASVDERDDGLYTTTSRASRVVGRGDSIAAAEAEAEDALAAAGDRVRIRHVTTSGRPTSSSGGSSTWPRSESSSRAVSDTFTGAARTLSRDSRGRASRRRGD